MNADQDFDIGGGAFEAIQEGGRIFRLRFFIIGIIALVAIGGIIGAAWRAKAQAAPKRIYLTAEQNAALDKFDAALAEISKQFQDVKGKRDFLLSGIVISNKETADLGFDWSKKFKETTVDGKRCLEEKSAEEIAKEKQ